MLEIGSETRQRLETFLADLTHRLQALRMEVFFHVAYEADHVRVDMSGEDSDCFLQRKAEALNALQHLLRKCMERPGDAGELPIVLDSHGYRRMREHELREMARIGSEQARTLGTELTLGPMNPYERRIIHLACQEGGGVVTKSIGDGFHKRVVISPAGGRTTRG